MSGTNPAYEICGLCEALRPSAELQDVYVKNAESGLPVRLRFCRSCLKPRLTYIQSSVFPWLNLDVTRVVTASLASILIVLNLVFGFVIGPPFGFLLAFAGLLVGSGIFALMAAYEH